MDTDHKKTDNEKRIGELLKILRYRGSLPVDELKELRSISGMTQAEMAKAISMLLEKNSGNPTQDMISRYENGLTPMPLEIANAYVQVLGEKLGHTLRVVIAEPEIPFSGINAGEPYRSYYSKLNFLEDYLREQSPVEMPDEVIANKPKDFEVLTRRLKRKPILTVIGRSDAGKSHLANCILGEEVLPSDYSPLTKVPLAVVHIDDRPEGISDEVVLLKGTLDFEILLDNGMIEAKSFKRGSMEAMRSYITHCDDELSDSNFGWAIVYSKSKVLKACTIIDTPGFGFKDEDTNSAEQAVKEAEIVIYCSPFGGCFSSEDELRLEKILRNLVCPENMDSQAKPLSNFIFAITHAGTQVNQNQLESNIKKVSSRFYKAFGQDTLKIRLSEGASVPSKEDIEYLFVPFWDNMPSRHEKLKSLIQEILSKSYPRYRELLADSEIKKYRDAGSEETKNKITNWEEFLNNWEEQKKRFADAEMKEPERLAKTQMQRQEICDKIEDSKNMTIRDFSDFFDSSCNADAIEKTIYGNFTSKEEAQNSIAPLIIKNIENNTCESLKKYSEEISDKINNFLISYNKSAASWGSINSKIDSYSTFDSFAAFAGGLAGLATLGALAFWASTVGNLGGYIIVAKVIGVIASLGIPTGSAAAIVASVAAFGGPIVFAIILSVLIGIAAFMAFWKSWQRRLAEKLHEEMKNSDMKNQIIGNIKSYWEQTLIGFNTAADVTEKEYQTEFKKIKEDLESNSRDRILSRIKNWKALNSFFDKLPWFGFGATGAK